MTAQSRRRRKRAARGFNLLEVMVSGVILLLGLAGILMGISASTKQYQHQRHMTQALQIAEGVMEELLVRGKESNDLNAGAYTGPSFDVDGAPVTGDGFFDTAWTVEAAPISQIPSIRKLTVTVTWDGGLRPVSLSTYRN